MRSKTLALLFLGLIVPAICSAQAIKPGTWTGSVIPPEGELTIVTYDVTMVGDTLGIVIHAGEHGDFTATEAKFDEKTIRFPFQPGPVVRCSLPLHEEGEYAGNCMEASGSVAQMTMVPPK